MKRLVVPIAALAATFTALAPLLLLDGLVRDQAFRAFAIGVGLLVAWVLMRSLDSIGTRPETSPFTRTRRWQPGRAVRRRLTSLVRTVRGTVPGRAVPRHPLTGIVRDSGRRIGAYHALLLPRLQAVADERLRASGGFTLADDPVRARAALGDHAFELLRADRPPPRDKRADGPGLEAIATTLDALEAL